MTTKRGSPFLYELFDFGSKLVRLLLTFELNSTEFVSIVDQKTHNTFSTITYDDEFAFFTDLDFIKFDCCDFLLLFHV